MNDAAELIAVVGRVEIFMKSPGASASTGGGDTRCTASPTGPTIGASADGVSARKAAPVVGVGGFEPFSSYAGRAVGRLAARLVSHLFSSTPETVGWRR